MLYELILINEIEQRAKIIFLSVSGWSRAEENMVAIGAYKVEQYNAFNKWTSNRAMWGMWC